MELVASWVGVGLVFLSTVVGWIILLNRQKANEAKHMGALEQKIEDFGVNAATLTARVQDLCERVSTLEGFLRGSGK